MKQSNLRLWVLGINALLTMLIFVAPVALADDAGEAEANLLYMQGRQRVLDGEFEKALPFLEKALKADPASAIVTSQLAEVYLRLSNFEKAETLARKAVELQPANAEYRNTFAGILASLRKFPEAREQYAKIMELDPTNAKVPLLLGIVEAESGNIDRGIETLSKTLSENGDNVMALFYRARMYLEADQVERAKADLEKALTIRPAFVEAGTALGLIHERMGNEEEAIKTYSRIQGSGAFRKRLAQLHLQRNEFEKALTELNEYVKTDPDDYGARVKVGLIYFEQKKFAAAKDVFQKVLKEQAEAENVRFYLGWVEEELKNYAEAMKNFRKVTKDSSLFREAMVHVGFILKEQKKYKEGVDFAKRLIQQNPDVEDFYDLHITFLDATKDYKQALAVASSATKRFPASEKLIYLTGSVQDKLGDKKSAIDSMRKIIAMNPKNYHALNFVGYSLAEQGENLEEAESLVRQARGLKPNDGFIEDSLGWVLFKQGKVDEALKTLEAAAALQPEEVVIIEHLGDVYLHKKEYAKAREFYKKAVTLASRDRETAKKIENKLAALPKTDKSTEARVPTASDKN